MEYKPSAVAEGYHPRFIDALRPTWHALSRTSWHWFLMPQPQRMVRRRLSELDACGSVTYNSQKKYQLQDYLQPDGTDPYAAWLTGLADRQARARVVVRVGRMAGGNFGDCKPVSEGVWELRIDWGPGYRVYYAMAGKRLILLLAGGDKRKQQADIDTAVARWGDWQKRRTDK